MEHRQYGRENGMLAKKQSWFSKTQTPPRLLSTSRINCCLIPALHSSPRAQLIGVASRITSHTVTYAREWSIPQTFDNYQSLRYFDAFDAVYIA